MFFFRFNQLQLKAGVVIQMIHPCFRKSPTVGQLNVQATMAEKGIYFE